MKTTQKVPTYKILQLKTNKTFKEYQHLFGFGESFDVTEENVSKEYQDESCCSPDSRSPSNQDQGLQFSTTVLVIKES